MIVRLSSKAFGAPGSGFRSDEPSREPPDGGAFVLAPGPDA
jgi:hypothetical protein